MKPELRPATTVHHSPPSINSCRAPKAQHSAVLLPRIVSGSDTSANTDSCWQCGVGVTPAQRSAASTLGEHKDSATSRKAHSVHSGSPSPLPTAPPSLPAGKLARGHNTNTNTKLMPKSTIPLTGDARQQGDKRPTE